jgi:hypothetical protein
MMRFFNHVSYYLTYSMEIEILLALSETFHAFALNIKSGSDGAC